MSWAAHHRKSEQLASEAEACARAGDGSKAQDLYRVAAQHELSALEVLDPQKTRTLGITTVSAASLAFKANDLRLAEVVACKWLSSDLLPAFAKDSLQGILQAVWSESAHQAAGVELVREGVLVALGGGIVVRGGAPLDLVHRKVDETKNLIYRIIEMLLNRPCRRRGPPSADIRENFRPWLLQAAPSSYAFAIRMEKPRQLQLFDRVSLGVEDITRRFLDVLQASSQQKDRELEEAIPDPEYRESFLKQTLNYAPTGKTFKRLDIRSTIDRDVPPIVLSPGSRDAITATLRRFRKPKTEEKNLTPEQVTGTLRALNLNDNWIEVDVPKEPHPIRIWQTGNVIDDIVGPMVNHRVVVQVATMPNGRRLFRDIQSEE